MSAEANGKNEQEIVQWLHQVFGTYFQVDIEGCTEKGDGYLGDVIFVKAQSNGVVKELVLKCAKKSETLRDQVPIRDVYKNEIYIYETVFPAFRSFEHEHGIQNTFHNVPHFYGSFVSDSMEVLVMDNLKKQNFALHDRTVPLTEKHIKLTLEAYGHFHAISAAFRDQQSEKFENLADGLIEVWRKFCDACSIDKIFANSVTESYQLLKGEIDENARNQWRDFGDTIQNVMDIVGNKNCFTVLAHGDCWNNNFLFKGPDNDPDDVAIIDWQVATYSTPIVDLSYFLFACLSKNDLNKIDGYLKFYYEMFSKYVHQLGSDPEMIFTYKQFLEDWRKYSRFGVMMAALVVKIAMTDKDECRDVEQVVDEGGQFGETFQTKIKNERGYMLRMKPLIQYVIENGLI